MDESNEIKKTRNITFRLTNEQYEKVENAGLWPYEKRPIDLRGDCAIVDTDVYNVDISAPNSGGDVSKTSQVRSTYCAFR